MDSGTDRAFPTIERLFTDTEAPGLVRQPSYLISSVFMRLDTRDVPGNTRSGSDVQIEHSFNRDRDFTRYSFKTDEHVFFRIDVGRGAEGTRVFFKFGPAF